MTCLTLQRARNSRLPRPVHVAEQSSVGGILCGVLATSSFGNSAFTPTTCVYEALVIMSKCLQRPRSVPPVEETVAFETLVLGDADGSHYLWSFIIRYIGILASRLHR
jgi:hypothetical protein